MNEGPYFLDVNVPKYAAGKAHPYKEPCVWVMTEIANGRFPLCPLRPRGVKARDVPHTAVMQNHQLSRIISTDKPFDRIDGITRLDPQTLRRE